MLLYFRMHREDGEIYDYSVTTVIAIYPFSTDNFAKYLACLNWEMLVVFLYSLYWAAADITFAELVSHLTIQLQVISKFFMNHESVALNPSSIATISYFMNTQKT